MTLRWSRPAPATACWRPSGQAATLRWTAYLEPIPDHLRDDDIADLRRSALRARSAYGPKDSVRDVVPREVTEPFLDAIDRLLKELARRDLAG